MAFVLTVSQYYQCSTTQISCIFHILVIIHYLLGYVIEMRLPSEKTWTKVATLEPSVTLHCIENLKERSELFFRVYAENSMGLSPPACTEIVSLKTHAGK